MAVRLTVNGPNSVTTASFIHMSTSNLLCCFSGQLNVVNIHLLDRQSCSNFTEPRLQPAPCHRVADPQNLMMETGRSPSLGVVCHSLVLSSLMFLSHPGCVH